MENLVQMLSARAAQTPSATAFTYTVNGQTADSLSYQELDFAARSAARRIRTFCPPGERVLLIHPPGLDFMVDLFGCFYAGAVAVTNPAPNLRNYERFATLVETAKPKLVLTTGEGLENIRQHPDVENKWKDVVLTSIPRGQDAAFEPYQSAGEDCAVIQFTSGSSSKPRGVMLSHQNILSNLEQMRRAFDFRIEERAESVVLWLPHFHDMGLFARLQCVWTNCPCHLMSPLEFTRRPVRWLELIAKTRATVSGGPNFAYELCAETISGDDRKRLNLSSWRVAFCGAEPIRHRTLERFAETFAECGVSRNVLTPCYGLAEATLLVSCAKTDRAFEILGVDPKAIEQGSVAPVKNGQARHLVSCGEVCEDIELEIVEPEKKRALPPEQIGEIWLRGPNVSKGYWGHDALNKKLFAAELKDKKDGRGYLRTGDLGFVKDGQLYISGRIKELIIVNGRNLHAEDIEHEVYTAHPSLRKSRAAAFATETPEGEYPVILFESPRQARGDTILLDEILHAVRRRIFERFEIEPARIIALRPGKIFLTSSGKVARQMCRRAFAAGTLEILAEWRPAAPAPEDFTFSPTEGTIVKLFEELVDIKFPNPRLPLRDLGGDSLTAVRLIARVQETFGIELEEAGAVNPSIKSLAEKVDDLLLQKIEAMSEDEAASALKMLENAS